MAVQASSAGPGRWRVALGILTILFTAVLVIVLNTLMIDLPTRKRAAYDVASSAGNKSTAGKARILSVPSFRPISIRRVRGQNMSSPRTVRRRSSEVDEIPSGHRERLLRDLGVGSALSVNGSWSSGDASSLPSFPFTARLGVSTSCVNPETLSWGKWAFPPRVVQVRAQDVAHRSRGYLLSIPCRHCSPSTRMRCPSRCFRTCSSEPSVQGLG